jgi:hypothetical protein
VGNRASMARKSCTAARRRLRRGRPQPEPAAQLRARGTGRAQASAASALECAASRWRTREESASASAAVEDEDSLSAAVRDGEISVGGARDLDGFAGAGEMGLGCLRHGPDHPPHLVELFSIMRRFLWNKTSTSRFSEIRLSDV